MATYAEMIGASTVSRIERFGHYDQFIDPETASVRDLNIVSHAVWAIAVALYELLPDKVCDCGCWYRPGFGGELVQNDAMMCEYHSDLYRGMQERYNDC